MIFTGVPSGLLVSNTMPPSYPTTSLMSSANSRILTSLPDPMFTTPRSSLDCITMRIPLARSSTCIKSLRADPVPHTTTLGSPNFFAS
ncbi:hypothetical protein ATCV1_z283R [Acanthocystis turfacea chlorella virus 1]|uniref:Uncharacterized protein z283R n=1 Tax=Chlorovirus heliozoae TaxID=322019 RepID=A7K8P3_9PHYC|nr:hypothetical protein ATCV1_z283R [Acanthocystis turfacea chlorella virus 1]ABT16417.1 hypothetical protein ATCV1_z283R [Acanthocystis turfacea chlorella virus 1]